MLFCKVIRLSGLKLTFPCPSTCLIVPGLAFCDAFTDAIVNEVIALHPDAFILTGDNTNGGSPDDVRALIQKLSRIRDAGILVVITTGNHDLDHCTAAEYEQAYFPLCAAADRDPASLSYTVLCGDTVLIAMDDNTATSGFTGQFPVETMAWHESILSKYQYKTILFLSHHSVLYGKEADSSGRYHINNEGLAQLLEQYNVSLAFTGHLHAQVRLEENGLHEVISAMPFSGLHTMGFLEIRQKQVHYETRVIDLDTYGAEGLADALREKDKENADHTTSVMIGILEQSSYSADEQTQILELIQKFLYYYSEGTMIDHMDEFGENSCRDKMIEVLWGRNYGPWMKSVLDNPPLNASCMEFSLP